MGKKSKKKKNVAPTPQKSKKRSGEGNGKISKAREAVRTEIRQILEAAREQKLIQKTATTVKKVRSFSTEDILSFISDVKVKTKEEVRKMIPKNEESPNDEVKKANSLSNKKETVNKEAEKSMSYYDRWYDLVTVKGEIDVSDYERIEGEVHEVVSAPVVTEKKFNDLPKGTSTTIKKTYKDYKNELSVDEIAEKRNLTKSTIYDHFAYLIQVGCISIYEVLDNTRISAISDAIRLAESDKLSDIMKECPGYITYSDIKLVVAHFEFLKTQQ